MDWQRWIDNAKFAAQIPVALFVALPILGWAYRQELQNEALRRFYVWQNGGWANEEDWA